jgi:competence protein ComEA
MLAKIIRKIQEKLGLTKSEAGIILFLSIGLLLGGSVKILHLDKATEKHDFTESDAFFAEASSKIDSLIAYEEDTLKNTVNRATGTSKRIDSPIDINLATIQEFMKLPGVGKVTAQRIVDYRASNGKFSSIEDLLKVKGIGKSKFEKIKIYLKAE